jgi:histone-lysine N-methyltransferase SETMAR
MFKTAVSAFKIMPTIVWDVKGVEYSEFMPTGKNINTLHIVKQYGSRKRDFEECVLTWSMLYFSMRVRPHTSVRTPAEVRRIVFTVLFHPPYDPNLAPSDFHLFPKLKKYLTGHHYASDDETSNQQLSYGSSIKHNSTSMELGNCWNVD